MIICRQCGKEVEQPVGKRKKEFCNETCRSNFWYAKNKKGVAKVTDANKPTSIKPITEPKPKSNYTVDTRKPFMSDAIRKKLGL